LLKEMKWGARDDDGNYFPRIDEICVCGKEPHQMAGLFNCYILT
jgi:hypothetical protein